MSRSNVPLVLGVVFALLLSPSPADALDSLEDVACVCGDGALNTGDYVSCIAHFSRRLEAHGIIDREQRQEAVRSASAIDLDALAESCAADDEAALRGWGVSLSVDRPFYPESFGLGPEYAADARLRQWNFSTEDAYQNTPTPPVGECSFVLTIRDAAGRVQRRDNAACPTVIDTLDLPAGSLEERRFFIPLSTLGSETGLPDGTQLRAGLYQLEVRWRAQGPQHGPGDVFGGGEPRATVVIRVGADP